MQRLPAGGDPDEPRYTMLETVREFAREQLEASGEQEVMRGRHTGYFVVFTGQLAAIGYGSSLRPLRDEMENLAAALRWTVETGDMERGLRLLYGAWPWISWSPASVRDWAERLLALPRPASAVARAHTLHAAGIAARRQGDLRSSRAWLEESVSLFRELGDAGWLAQVLGTLAYEYLPNYVAARAVGEEGVVLARQSGDRVGLARALSDLGTIERLAGETAAAQGTLEEGLRHSYSAAERSVRWARYTYHTLQQLALIDVEAGNYTAARDRFEECLALSRQGEEEWETARTLYELGLVLLQQEELPSAERLLTEGFTLSRQVGNARGASACLEALAAALILQGEPERGCRLFGAAAALSQSAGLGAPSRRNTLLQELRAHAVAVAEKALGRQGYTEALRRGESLGPDRTAALLALPHTPADAEAATAAAERGGPLPLHGSHSPYPALSSREVEVLRLLAAGLTNRAIAAVLVLSVATVQNHVASIFRMLGVRSRAEAAALVARAEQSTAAPGTSAG